MKERKNIEKEVIKYIIGTSEISSDESNEKQTNRLGYFLIIQVRKKGMLYFLKAILSLLYNTAIPLDVQGCYMSFYPIRHS